jgi:DNA-directed RNA polymerase subunit K/omega
MNKYEQTRLLAERAKQLENGAIPTVDVTNLNDALRIAQKELQEGVIPLEIKRREPDGTFNYEDELSGESDGDSGEYRSGNEVEDVAGETSSEDGDSAEISEDE